MINPEEGQSDESRRFEWLRHTGVAAWSIVGVCGVAALLVWLIIQLRAIWPPLIFAVIIVFLFNPVVDLLEQYRVPRVVGGCLSYLLLGGVLVLIGALIIPLIRDQAADLVEQLPQAVARASEFISDLFTRPGILGNIPVLENLSGSLSGWFSNLDIGSSGWFGQLTEIVRGVLETAVAVLLAPVLAFYILVDAPNLTRAANRMVPAGDRAEAFYLARQIGKAVGGFIRGQLVVAIIVGLLSSLALRLLDLPFWLIVGMIAGLLNIVPFIGPWVGGALGVSTALMVGDPLRAVWVAVAFLAIQQLDNHFVSPMILRVAVHLNPATIILALLAGNSIGGLFGVLIAVPLTAVLKIVTGHLWRTRVLGESWDQAAQAIVVEYEPEPLRERLRRGRSEDLESGHQAGGISAASEVSGEGGGPAPRAPHPTEPSDPPRPPKV